MALFPVAGMKFFIGGVLSDKPTDFVASDFAGQTWIEVDGWTNAGEVGDSSALITTALINRGRDIKQKGTANAGSAQMTFAIIPDDAGQLAMLAASKSRSNYAFRIDGNDAVGSGAPSKRYFIGLVMMFREVGGEANTIRNISATVEINSNIVAVDAT